MENRIEEKIEKQKETKRCGNPQWVKGVTGNPHGRPRAPEVAILREALLKAKEKRGIDFIEHFVNMAYDNKECAIALMKKLISDKIEGEGFAPIYQFINFGEINRTANS